MKTALAPLLILLGAGAMVWTQSPADNEAGVSMGHIHLNATDSAAHKRLWVDLLGATPTSLGDMDVLKLPNLLIFLRERKPTGGTKGTIVNHVGLQVRELAPLVTKLKSAGVPIVTQSELKSIKADSDIVYIESQDTHIAFIMGPDRTKIELSENPGLSVPPRR